MNSLRPRQRQMTLATASLDQPALFDWDEPAPEGADGVPALVDASVPAHGVVYTRPWLVRFTLDLAGYTEDRDLAAMVAIEPSVGEGAFLTEMARRLTRSCIRHERPLADMGAAIIAFDTDPDAACVAQEAAAQAIVQAASGNRVTMSEAASLAERWVRTGDFLLAATGETARRSRAHVASGASLSADFVVGNPPYVRIENFDPALMDRYRRAYPTMRGRADLYVGFFEAALRLLRPGGACAFVCADRWMRNQYGAGLRHLISAGSFHVAVLAEMRDADSFEDAVSAYPAVTAIRRPSAARASASAPPIPLPPTIVARAGENAAACEETQPGSLARLLATAHVGQPLSSPEICAAAVHPWFTGDHPWPHVSPGRLALLRRLESAFPPLEHPATGTRVGIGVATGADRVFITRDSATVGAVEPECLVPLALAADALADRHVVTWSGHYLLDPGNIASEAALSHRYPKLYAYLLSHGDLLRGRHVAEATPRRWFRTIDRVDRALTARPKLYLADIRGRIAPVLDTGSTYPHHNLYVVTSDTWDMEVLGGLLLSDVAQLFVESYAVRMRGGYLRFQAQYLRRIRVPHRDNVPEDIADQLRTAFRARDASQATAAAFRLFGIDEIPEDIG